MNSNGKNIAIGFLSLSAVILLCTLLILGTMQPQAAQASGPLDRQGDYVMLPGGTNQGPQAVYVIDLGTRRMAAYMANIKGRVEVLAIYDLGLLPQPRAAGGGGGGRGR